MFLFVSLYVWTTTTIEIGAEKGIKNVSQHVDSMVKKQKKKRKHGEVARGERYDNYEAGLEMNVERVTEN